MPVHKVMTTKDGKQVVGYKWGNSGKVYTGPNAQSRAAAQGRAAWTNGYRGKK